MRPIEQGVDRLRLVAHGRERRARLASQTHEAQLAAQQGEVRKLEEEMRGLHGERQRLIEERQTFVHAVYSKHLKERTEGGSRSSRGRPSSPQDRQGAPRQSSPLREAHNEPIEDRDGLGSSSSSQSTSRSEAEEEPRPRRQPSMGSFARLAQRRGWTA